MKTQQQFRLSLLRTTAVLVGVLASTLWLVSAARAEAQPRFQPDSLAQAERALEQGQPERALAHLHRQRAILRHSTHRPQGEALACEAYRQLQDFQRAARVCDAAMAYESDSVVVEPFQPSKD